MRRWLFATLYTFVAAALDYVAIGYTAGWKYWIVGGVMGFPLGLWLAEARRSEKRLFIAELYQDEMRRLEREVASLR